MYTKGMECNRLEFLELSQEILGNGNCLRFQAYGGSMLPFIKNGQIIQVRPTKISEINSGDIIFYHSVDNRIVVHRVIKKRRENGKIVMLAKGDSSSYFDKYVYPERILGKVVAIERKGRRIKINSGLYGVINTFCAKLSPFSNWIYPPLRKIKHKINKIKDRYATRRVVSALSCRSKH